jgi:hypothetical protein
MAVNRQNFRGVRPISAPPVISTRKGLNGFKNDRLGTVNNCLLCDINR